MLSATMDAAGTAHESVRSLCASFVSLECISTDRSGLIKVGMGFMAIRKTMGWALLMPPSIPPALFEYRINLFCLR